MRLIRMPVAFATFVTLTIASTAGAQQSIEQQRAKFAIKPPATVSETELGRFHRGPPSPNTGEVRTLRMVTVL